MQRARQIKNYAMRNYFQIQLGNHKEKALNEKKTRKARRVRNALGRVWYDGRDKLQDGIHAARVKRGEGNFIDATLFQVRRLHS